MSHLPMLSNHTAQKQYRCDAGFTCIAEEPRTVILPGDRYTAEVYPPWTRTQEDPDGPVVNLGSWITHRYHVECYGGPW